MPTVTLPDEVLAACEAEASRCHPFETGGAFMGRRGTRGEYLVEHMIGPGPKADHRRTSFAPDAGWQWAEMRRLHARDTGLAFLGDWHTHPDARTGSLSGTDLSALKTILRAKATLADAVLSVIVYGSPRAWRWQSWEAEWVAARERPTLRVRKASLART